MTYSIRKYLLINLLLALFVTSILNGIGDFYLDRKDIEKHLDTLLAQAAFSLKALMGEDIHARDLSQIQHALQNIPISTKPSPDLDEREREELELKGKFQFQIWADDGILLLHSARAPKLPLSSGDEGYSTKEINKMPWRVYTTYDAKLRITVVVAERLDFRKQLAIEVSKNDLFIVLLIIPISGLLIWLIIGKGLWSLKRVTDEVSARKPGFLEPVSTEKVPSEIKPLVDELNKLFLKLHEALEREKRFAADAAHELRTPLAALKTQAQVALFAKDDEDRKETIRNIISGVNRSAHVVQQLLTLSRLIPGAPGMGDVGEVNLSALAAEVIGEHVPLADKKNIEIEMKSDPESVKLNANAAALGILLRNLIDNAIRYTPEKGTVTVELSEKRNKAILRVIDNGPGIPAELRARVFERFFRVLGNKTTGSGLGLAIVQQIAELHGATVKLGTPATGKGLQVEIIFT